MTAHQQIEDREREILSRLPLETDHVPDEQNGTYDAVLLEPFSTTPPITLEGRLVLDAGTPLELKTCRRWIKDRHSGGGRRRGQFKINEATHGKLAELGGAYVFLVLEDDEIVVGHVVEARAVDELPAYETSKAYAARRATVPWFKVVPRRSLA